MAIISNDESRIVPALDKAEQAFWTDITTSFPEASTGDLSPNLSIKLSEAMRNAVVEWLEFNADVLPEFQIAEIMLHRIEYYYKGGYAALLLTDSDKEHIAYSITQGISEAELCTTLDISETESKEVYGYWKINNNPE